MSISYVRPFPTQPLPVRQGIVGRVKNQSETDPVFPLGHNQQLISNKDL